MSGIHDAFKRLAAHQAGGMRALATRLTDANENTLYHKADPKGALRGHNLFATEVEEATLITGDPEIAKYLAQLCDHVCIPVGGLASANDSALLMQLAALCKDLGEVSGGLTKALDDDKISTNEEKTLDQQIEALVEHAMELRKRIHAKALRDRAGRE